jgi:hypothetical protein
MNESIRSILFSIFSKVAVEIYLQIVNQTGISNTVTESADEYLRFWCECARSRYGSLTCIKRTLRLLALGCR